jgi:hypothetical protein
MRAAMWKANAIDVRRAGRLRLADSSVRAAITAAVDARRSSGRQATATASVIGGSIGPARTPSAGGTARALEGNQ